MVFTNPIASGLVLVRPALQSPNYVPGVSGWAINRDGTAEFNGVTVRGALHIGGPAPLAGIDGYIQGVQPQLRFNSGVVGETLGALLFADVNAPANQPVIAFASATTNNGVVELFLGPANAGGWGQATFATSGDTAPVGANGVKSFLNANADYQTRLKNANAVATAWQALTIGDINAAHLRGSPSELQAITAASTPTPLALQPMGAGVSAPDMRAVGAASGAAAGVNVASLVYAALPGVQATSVNLPCPPSGTLIVAIAAQVFANAAAVVGDFVALCVNVVNNTAASTPFGAADTRCTTLTAELAGTPGGNLTLARTYVVGALGNPGDSLTVSIFARTGVANRFGIFRTELAVMPSL